jgi:hypothetical protein
MMLLFVAKTFLDHSYSQKEEQTEGNPMVVLLDEAVEMIGSEPAYQRHQGLEKTEKEADSDESFPAYAAQDDTAGNGNRKTIHGQTDCQ